MLSGCSSWAALKWAMVRSEKPSWRHRYWASSKWAAASDRPGGRAGDRATTSSGEKRVAAVGALFHPVLDPRHVALPLLQPPDELHHPQCPLTDRHGTGRLGRSDDRAVLINPDDLRDIGHPEAGVHVVGLVDERGVGGPRRLHKRTGHLWAGHLQADVDHLKRLVMQLPS